MNSLSNYKNNSINNEKYYDYDHCQPPCPPPQPPCPPPPPPCPPPQPPCPPPQPPCDPCHNGHRHYFNPCPPKYVECSENVDLHPLPGSALLEIGTGNSPVVNATNVAGITATTPLPVAQVTIDPTCLCFPNIKIEFSSIVVFTALTAVTSVTVQLSRIRFNYGPTATREPLETFTLTSSGITGGTPAFVTSQTMPFSFVYGDATSSSRPRTYSVDIIGATGITGAATVQFTNVNMLALAVGGLRTF